MKKYLEAIASARKAHSVISSDSDIQALTDGFYLGVLTGIEMVAQSECAAEKLSIVDYDLLHRKIVQIKRDL